MEMSSRRDHGSVASRVNPRSVSAAANASRTNESVSGANLANALSMVEVEKRKIPAFQRCMPSRNIASALSVSGFSTNEDSI